MGELENVVGPTRQMGELDGVIGPTPQMGELDSVVGPTLPFGELDDGFFAFRDPLYETLSNLSWRLIVWIIFGVDTKLDLGFSHFSFDFFLSFSKRTFPGKFPMLILS